MMRILISDDLSPEAKSILERIPGAQVDFKPGMKAAELLQVIGQYDALAVRSATKVTAEVLAAATQLRVIGRAGTGVDNIDLAAATRRGVVVMNAPGGNSVSVAEHTVALLLSLARSIADASQSTRAGKWEKKKYSAGRELYGKTLGVVGTGNIGQLVVLRARAFGMKIIAYDPFLSADAAAKLGVELVELPEIFRRSDAITLHVPLTEQTRNMVSAATLAQMKPGALLVNCARGGLVDERAVADALRSKHLGGAALDVFEIEPPAADHPLFSCENFIATPHLGGSTEDAQQNVAVIVCEAMVEYLTTGTVRNAVNMPNVSGEVLERLRPFPRLGGRLGAFPWQGALQGEGGGGPGGGDDRAAQQRPARRHRQRGQDAGRGAGEHRAVRAGPRPRPRRGAGAGQRRHAGHAGGAGATAQAPQRPPRPPGGPVKRPKAGERLLFALALTMTGACK